MMNAHRSFAFPVLSKLTPFNLSKTGSYLEANKNTILKKYGVVSIFLNYNCVVNIYSIDINIIG